MIPAGGGALITDASGGIGLADELEGTHHGLSATLVAIDLSTTDGPTALMNKLEQAGITGSLLIDNAGVGSLRRLVAEDCDAILRDPSKDDTTRERLD